MKNSADLGECYSPRPSASVDNTLLDLQNSSYPTQPHSIIAKYLFSAFIFMDIIKCALQHFVMKVGCYVTDDAGGNYATFHELNRRSRKD